MSFFSYFYKTHFYNSSKNLVLFRIFSGNKIQAWNIFVYSLVCILNTHLVEMIVENTN